MDVDLQVVANFLEVSKTTSPRQRSQTFCQ
jgi:hypothetical protein